MAFCKEKLVNYLAGMGYNLVRLPRTGIDPLQVIVKEDSEYNNLGPLSKVWVSENKPPVPNPDDTAANIQQKKTSLIDVSVGVKALDDIFSGMGFSVPSLNAAFSKVKKLKIGFNNVTVSKIDPFDIGNYLKSGDVNHLDTENVFVKYFLDDEKPIYIISETLRSNSITIEAYKDEKTSADMDLGILKAIKADAKINTETDTDSAITYAGEKQLTFGFKCYQIDYTEDGWGITGTGKDTFLDLETAPEPVQLGGNRTIKLNAWQNS